MIEANKVYSMEIISAGLAENKAGDKSCVELELACESGRLWHRLWLTEPAKERVAKTLAEFGISAGSQDFWDANCSALVGQTATVETEEHEYQGKTSVRVKWFNGPKRARESKPLPPSKVSAIAAMFSDVPPVVADDDSDGDSVPFR